MRRESTTENHNVVPIIDQQLKTIVYDDIRRYVFPLYLAPPIAQLKEGEALEAASTQFLGTGFFVSKTGVALTAGHCIPSADRVTGHDIVATVSNGTELRAYRVAIAALIPGFDVAILKIEVSEVPYFDLDFRPEMGLMGEDVQTIGIPEHSVSGGKEFRCLKGHVTFRTRYLELSFPAPRGMSGSPILVGNRVCAVLTGNARSEALEDSLDETSTDASGHVTVTRTKVMSVVNYGLAEPLAFLGAWTNALTRNKTFPEFLRILNSR